MANNESSRVEGGKRCHQEAGEKIEPRPLVSIITAVFNGVETLEETLRSVVNQTFGNFEYIVVDGCSTDGTIDLLKAHDEEIDYWISEEDNGVYDAMNKGIDLARGDWLYFIGADDRLVDDSVLQRFFAQPVDSEFLYGNVFWGGNGKTWAGEFHPERFYDQNICQQAIFYHRKLFQRLGKFDLNYRLVADWVFNMKAFGRKTTKPVYFDTVVAVYSLDGMSTDVWDEKFLKTRKQLYIRSFGMGAYIRFRAPIALENAKKHSPKLRAVLNFFRNGIKS